MKQEGQRNKEMVEIRRMGADSRAAEYGVLTPQQKVAKLDKMLGVGLGAVKQRAKLAKAMADAAKPKPVAKAPVKAKK